MDFDEARSRLTDDVRLMLYDYENVNGAGIGVKQEDGFIVSREPHIIVHVSHKIPPSDLDEDEIIPEEVNGVPTDVIVVRNVTPDNRQSRFRPVVGGVSCGHVDTTYGTIGTPVIDAPNGQRVVLTAAHVADPSNSDTTGQSFLQPGPSHGGVDPDDSIGTVHELGKRDSSSGVTDNCDTALIAVNSDIQSDYMWGAGQFAGFENANFNTRYIKFGTTTGLTSGMLVESDADVEITANDGTTYSYTGVERYERFHDGGDSGALNCRIDRETGDIYGVSVHFAGSSAENESWAIPWSMIETQHGTLTAARS